MCMLNGLFQRKRDIIFQTTMETVKITYMYWLLQLFGHCKINGASLLDSTLDALSLLGAIGCWVATV